MKRRILFVDDEKRVLDGLRRMLRVMREEWDMDFAESGAQALEMLRETPFDVVVTDMRMPQMDGAVLLNHVKDVRPEAVRIVLSGYADREMIMKAFRSAHQYLVKPSDAETLKSVIGRACALRDLMSSKALKQLISRTDSLPSMPVAYTRVMDLMETNDASASTIGQVISEDLGMTAKILQLANSAFFGLPRRFTDVTKVVVYLGADILRSLVLSCGLFSRFNAGNRSGLDGEALFRHSRDTSLLARAISIAEKLDKTVTDDSFMAGLLHDVGKLVIADSFPDIFRGISERSRTENRLFHEVEIETLGATHAEVGAYLMGLWGLSDVLVEAIAYHHRPAHCAATALVPMGVVHAANALAHEAGSADGQDLNVEGLDAEYFERLGAIDRIPVWRRLAGELERG